MAPDFRGHPGEEVSTVITCEGTLGNPEFPRQFQIVVDRLNGLLGVPVKVRKLEPWNSVRVTLSVPREAALRLRQLAQQSASQLRDLGILSVQLDGEGIISLRLQGANGQPQEVVLRTTQDGPSGTNAFNLAALLPTASGTTTTAVAGGSQVQFKSPNVVCPADSVVPRVGANMGPPSMGANPVNKPPYAGPFPFASMNQAIHSQSNTSSTAPSAPRGTGMDPPPFLPPPYPGIRQTPPASPAPPASQPVSTISSPLLVNLLQNDQPGITSTSNMRPPPPPVKVPTTITVPSAQQPLKSPAPLGVVNSHTPSVGVVNSHTTQVLVNPNSSTVVSPSSALSIPSVTNSSAVTSTQLAINSIANSLANSAANSRFGGQHQYQRTPQGSIIAVNKPPLPITTPNSIPLQRTQPQVRQQLQPNNKFPSAHSKFVPGNNLVPASRLPLQEEPLQVAPQASQVTNIIKKPLPSPPPYNVAIRNQWGNPTDFLDLAPSLTDLKPDELDELLPTLDHDALPELSELEMLGHALNSNAEMDSNSNSNHSESTTHVSQHTSNRLMDGRKFLINPLTGELEPQSGEEEESENEEVKDVFTGLASPVGLSDEDTNSTIRLDTNTDQSDSETRSSTEGKHSRMKNSKARREGRDSPAQKPEKIKLRLKLEKNEPINPAYKVDVSFINTQPKKASTSIITTPQSIPTAGGEELRVPPLHISLRGRNSAVIKNKTKLNPDGTPVVKKARKLQNKVKKEGELDGSREPGDISEHKKAKKFKSNHEHKDFLMSMQDHPGSPTNNSVNKYLHNHFKEKQKERRGSDSDLVRTNNKRHDVNGALVGEEKKRRLSQSEGEKRIEEDQVPLVLGSTNVGTVGVLPQKIRKDKMKIKENFKLKDPNRKLYSTSKPNSIPPSPPDKSKQSSLVPLPTTLDMDMEAKFKQSLMEGVIGEKGVSRPPYRTVEVVSHVQTDGARIGSVGEKVPKSPLDEQVKEKSPEPDKCNERKSIDLPERDKQVTSGGRSPNSGGGQGEDSGIESMDALSEKSPNQASQSPHADISAAKSQVPDMLDIEAQLAKMEGLEEVKTHPPPIDKEKSPNRTNEDVNENECNHRSDSKRCCELTCTLEGKEGVTPSLEMGKDEITSLTTTKEESSPTLRVAPALYSFPSNADKGGGQDSRGGSESPSLTTEDEDSNFGTSTAQAQQVNNKSKSLLEQLLIEIPEHGNAVAPSSHSPATRSSVRTRALSKLNSPELNSPVPKAAKTAPAPAQTAKRKRNESDSSNHSVEEIRKRPRKGSEAADVVKSSKQQGNAVKKSGSKVTVQNSPQDESSDSDEPLIEKMRKGPKTVKMVKSGAQTGPSAVPASQVNNKTNIRRSARAGQEKQQQTPQPPPSAQQPDNKSAAPITRSREKPVPHVVPNPLAHNNAEVEAALRRKTRSADVESKRKKEVK